MKKLIALLLVLVMVLSMAACKGNKNDNPSDDSKPQEAERVEIKDTVEILTKTWEIFPTDLKFACGGGSGEAMVMDAPGAVPVTDTDTLTYMLNVPETLQAQIVDAASLMHMMNANTFTAGAYKITGEVNAFVNTLKEGILSTQWMCGFPELLVIATIDDYVIAFYGNTQLVNTFATYLTTAYRYCTVMVEENML